MAAAVALAPPRMASEVDERHRPSMGSHTFAKPSWQTETIASDRSKMQHESQTTGEAWPSSRTRGRSSVVSCRAPQRQTWPDVVAVATATLAHAVVTTLVGVWCGGAGETERWRRSARRDAAAAARSMPGAFVSQYSICDLL